MSAAPSARQDGPPGASPALALRGLRVRRGGHLVVEVEALDLQPGETLAVLGPNGAGKSSLLLAAALLIPADGDVRYEGTPRTRRNAVGLRRRASTVFQDAALLDMSARRNVEEALAIRGVPRRERRARAEHWLGRLGVSHRAEARAHQLSGGEAQRVSLARALAVEPRLLFLDEPFAGLDLGSRGRLVGEMRALLRETGVTAMLTAHDHAEAAILADRVVVLDHGQVVDVGPAERVLTHPATPEVARLLGCALVEPRVARVLGVDPAGGVVAIPPSAVRVTTPDDPRAVLKTSIVSVEGVAGAVRLVLAGSEGLAAEVTLSDFHEHGWLAGEQVAVEILAERVVRYERS